MARATRARTDPRAVAHARHGARRMRQAMLICERSMLHCDPPEMDEVSEWCRSGGASPPVELDKGGVSAPEADPPLEVGAYA